MKKILEKLDKVIELLEGKSTVINISCEKTISDILNKVINDSTISEKPVSEKIDHFKLFIDEEINNLNQLINKSGVYYNKVVIFCRDNQDEITKHKFELHNKIISSIELEEREHHYNHSKKQNGSLKIKRII